MSAYDYSNYYAAGAPPPGGADGHYGAPQQQYYGAPPANYGAPPYNAPQPYGGPQFGGPPGAAGIDEVRTIFITGFPLDVKERELNNMMRFMPGYEASQMNWKNGAAQGFALFATGALGRSACDAITQLQFDEASTLRCEMARKNMYIKDMESAGKRPRTGPGPSPGGFVSGSSFGGAPSSSAAAPYRPAQAGAGASGSPADNPPGNTLFVGNLSETVNEAELNSIFATQPGFRQLKVVRGRNTTAFVEFDTIDNAIKTHNSQQNAPLASNLDRGGIRIQYSRNPFGKKRDVTGVMIDTPVRNPDYIGGAMAGAGEAPGTGL